MSSSTTPLSIWHIRSNQHGASAIEFAIVLPFMLLIFYGIICYSLILLHKQALTTISSEAARATVAVVDPSKINLKIQEVVNRHSWIASRVTDCGGGGNNYGALSGNTLTLCMRTSLPTSPPLPTIDLSVFGLPTLPPDTTNMLTTTVSVMWQP